MKHYLLSTAVCLTATLASTGAALRPLAHEAGFTPLQMPLKSEPLHAPALHATPLQGGVTVLSEDFSRCTKGTEAIPDAEGIVGALPASWVGTDGWNGATAHQAGGCLYLDSWVTQSNGRDVTVYLLDTPALTIASGTCRVTFRARSLRPDTPLYLINANAATATSVSSKQVTLSASWEEYEVTFTDCTAQMFVEFQADAGSFYIDDIEVVSIPDVTAPQVLPATDITAEGYTANWTAVDYADGYLVYPRVSHVADGIEPSYLLNTGFEQITEGTVQEPVEPKYVIESLDDFTDSHGWLVRLPLRANSALGLTNKYLQSYGNSLLQSPTLNLSGNSGNVDVSLRWLAQDVDMFQVSMYEVRPDGKVSLRSTKMVYTGEEFNEWKESEFTIGGGTASSMLVILLPETTQGTVFFDRISMSQTLEEGTRFIIPGATVNATTNTACIATPGLSPDDSRSYSVRAYRIVGDENIISAESNSITVGADSDEVPESLEVPVPGAPTVNGARFTASWEPVEGANAYDVQLFCRHVSDGNESVTVIDEDFDAIVVGTDDLDYPRAMHEDGYDRLDEYTSVPGWEVFQGFYVDGAVGILGYWNMLGVGCYMRSPIFDLSADGGNMTLSLKVGSDYYEQGATVYLAHENPETGAITYDDELPLNEMSKGFHPFTTTFSHGRTDSFLVFFPYGYGVSYFDDILVTQRVAAGTHDTRMAGRTVTRPTVTMTVPNVNNADEYFFTVRALFLDSTDAEKVASEASAPMFIEGLSPATYYAGKVLDADGKGIAGATVTLTSDNTSLPPVSGRANRWGIFRVENVSDPNAYYTAAVTAPGYRPAFATDLQFTGLTPVTEAEITLLAADDSKQIGTPTNPSDVGALYLQYNNSDTETLYTAEMLGIPANSKILSVSFDGYCETEKEVTPEITVLLENAEATEPYAEAAAAISPAAEEFFHGTVTLNQTGAWNRTDELLHFENPDGFLYTGKSLRVALRSRGNRNSDFFFTADATQRNRSIYRYWNRGAEGDWELNPTGMPVMRITYKAPVTGVESVVTGLADGSLSVRTEAGAAVFTAERDMSVAVYTPTGMRVALMNLTAGTTQRLTLAQGIYIINGKKFIIK